MPDEILTLPEVAGLLKVAEKTVYTMAQRAEIPGFKVRGQWRFKRVDLDHWIEAQKGIHNPPAQPADAESPDAILKRLGRQNDH
jgi:excisionase family DNA binding protein